MRKAALMLSFLAASAVGVPNPRILSPAGTFHLRDALPAGYEGSSVTIHQFQAASSGLYFLVSKGFNFAAGGHIVKTDFSGKRLLNISVGPGQYRIFAVDDGGEVYVAMLDRGADRRIVVYGPGGGQQRTIPFRASARALCVDQGTPVLLSRDGFLSAVGDTARPTVGVGQGRRVQLQRLPDGRLVVLKGVETEIVIVDPDRGVEKSFTPDAPEIPEARKRYGEREQGVILNSLAVAANGEIYVGVSGHRLAEGAPVLVLGANGGLHDRLRLMLPQTPASGDSTEPPQRMLPSFLGVADGKVFVADSAGLVARYVL